MRRSDDPKPGRAFPRPACPTISPRPDAQPDETHTTNGSPSPAPRFAQVPAAEGGGGGVVRSPPPQPSPEPGGCDHCNAYQTVTADPQLPGLWHNRIHHDDWCPWLASKEHR